MGKKTLKTFDRILFSLVLVVSLFGLIMVYDASVAEAHALFADKYYFLKQQSLWLLLGWLGLLWFSWLPLNWLKKISPWLLIAAIGMLVLVLIPGLGTQTLGARRWLNIAGFQLQPTEPAKLFLMIYLAAWLEKSRPMWQFLLILGIILGLIMLQPDLGTAIVIVMAAVFVFYIAGASLKSLIVLAVLGAAAGSVLIFSSPYRLARLTTYLNPLADPLGSSYHIRQALIAVGSGGVGGLGIGESRQKYQFLPQVTTDSIFAVIAEETGFLGAGSLILILLAIIIRALRIARLAADRFSALLAVGISCWLMLQMAINLGAMLAVLPLTGVPLPFISYGGSSLIVCLAGIGVLLNISRNLINPKKRR